jgi:hypothetical protein
MTEGAPVMLMFREELLLQNMRAYDVKEHEVLEAIRQHGGGTSPHDVLAVVLRN